MGELSSARQALEGADLAKADRRTLELLTDVNRRPDRPCDPLPEELTAYEPMAMFDLNERLFARNLRSSRRGAAGGPSGYDHCVTSAFFWMMLGGMQLFTALGSRLAKALVPQWRST